MKEIFHETFGTAIKSQENFKNVGALFYKKSALISIPYFKNL